MKKLLFLVISLILFIACESSIRHYYEVKIEYVNGDIDTLNCDGYWSDAGMFSDSTQYVFQTRDGNRKSINKDLIKSIESKNMSYFVE
jgi:hypothetical protein